VHKEVDLKFHVSANMLLLMYKKSVAKHLARIDDKCVKYVW